MLSLAEAHAVEKARRFCPQRQRPGDYDRLKLLADAIVADLELCGIRCCRQLPALRHRTQVSWAGIAAERRGERKRALACAGCGVRAGLGP